MSRSIEIKTEVIANIIAIFFIGWILFLTYNSFRADAWPYLGLWTAVGVSYLFNYAARKLRGAA